MFYLICKDGTQLNGSQTNWDAAKSIAEEHGGIREAGLTDGFHIRKQISGADGYCYFVEATTAIRHSAAGAASVPADASGVVAEYINGFFSPDKLMVQMMATIEESRKRLETLNEAFQKILAVNLTGDTTGMDERNRQQVMIQTEIFKINSGILKLFPADLVAEKMGDFAGCADQRLPEFQEFIDLLTEKLHDRHVKQGGLLIGHQLTCNTGRVMFGQLPETDLLRQQPASAWIGQSPVKEEEVAPA